MATTDDTLDGMTERCDSCGTDTFHEVSIQIRTESGEGKENAAFSREPYRVAECARCGERHSQRMNNA